ncbi:MAG: DUF1848 domain-containing protein [Anaeroplasmataceae bacterium]|nr:DUF1848 domain-containing protein [Anaeroplasmataceae bacterium]
MILNTGARTDIVQYFSDWLLKRFEEGFVYVRNPFFPNKVTRYELSPDKIDAVLFCSKNYAPILPRLYEITNYYNTYFYYTITAYDKDIEPGVPSIEESIDTLIKLSKQVGRGKVAWRYDPILLTKKYTIEVHKKTFEAIAKRLAPYIDRCIFSFVELYKKVEKNMPELIPFSKEDKKTLAQALGSIAKRYGIRIQICGTNESFKEYGIATSGCTTLDILSKANGIQFKEIHHKGMREGCRCIESRDIGAYDTCLNGCKYCYANQSPQQAYENYKYHNPNSPILLGEITLEDCIISGVQTSYIQTLHKQTSIFDMLK